MDSPHHLPPSEITVVLHGPAHRGDGPLPSLATVVASVRATLPGARIVWATWRGEAATDVVVDERLDLDDPGPLPPMKFSEGAPNNANRQIVSVRAGLAAVRTRYALKMRTDCHLIGRGFAAHFDAYPARDAARALFERRVVSLTHFTLNPRTLEPVPFHLSDVFQFGLTADLRLLWSAPLLTAADASYFERHAHRADGPAAVRAFRFRLGVEPHLFLHALRTKFDVPFDSLDAVDRPSIRASERFLANNVILLAAAAAGVVWPKYQAARASSYQRFNCYSHDQWRDLYRRFAGGTSSIATRLHVWREGFAWLAYLTLRRRPGLERVVNRAWLTLKAARRKRL